MLDKKKSFIEVSDYLDLAGVETYAHDSRKKRNGDFLTHLQEISQAILNYENTGHIYNARVRQVETFKECIDYLSADINQINSVNEKGQTLLHMAFNQHNYPLQMLLLHAGAALTIKDTEGNLPFVHGKKDGQNTKSNVTMLEYYFLLLVKQHINSATRCNICTARLCEDLNRNRDLCFVICVPEKPQPENIYDLNETHKNGIRIVVHKSINTESKVLGFYKNPITNQAADIKIKPEEHHALFSRHSNLNMIKGSSFKSKGFGGDNHVISKQPCVILCCYHKGYAPFGENEFPDKIEGHYQTDVQEGFCYTTANNKYLKSGHVIKRRGLDKFGTLGGFVKLPGEKRGFLTCAHVLLHAHEWKFETSDKRDPVVQVVQGTPEEVGKIKKIEFTGQWKREFSQDNIPQGASVDAALVELNPDVKLSGYFSDIPGELDDLFHFIRNIIKDVSYSFV